MVIITYVSKSSSEILDEVSGWRELKYTLKTALAGEIKDWDRSPPFKYILIEKRGMQV